MLTPSCSATAAILSAVGIFCGGAVFAAAQEAEQQDGPLRDAVVTLPVPSGLHSLEFSPDGKQLAAGCVDGSARIWSTANWQEPIVISPPHFGTKVVVFSPNGKSVVLSGHDTRSRFRKPLPDRLQSWTLEEPRQVWELIDPPEIRDHRFSADSQFLAVAAGKRNFLEVGPNSGLIYLLDPLTGKVLKELSGHADVVTSIAFAPQRNVLVSSSFDKTVRVWDVESGESVLLHDFAPVGGVEDVALSPDGKLLALAGYFEDERKRQMQGALRLYNLPYFTLRPTENLEQSYLLDAEFAGKTLITCAYDHGGNEQEVLKRPRRDDPGGMIVFWDTALGKPRSTVRFPQIVRAIAVSPDGSLLAAGVGGHSAASLLAPGIGGDIVVEDPAELRVWRLSREPKADR